MIIILRGIRPSINPGVIQTAGSRTQRSGSPRLELKGGTSDTPTGVLPRGPGQASMEYMTTVGGGPPVQSTAYAELLLESGLITGEQLRIARAAKAKTGSRIDEILMGLGMVDADALLKVMARAWDIPTIDLTTSHIDDELVRHWSGQLYLSENWMPVRDQANGSVLVATARIPDAEKSAHVASVLQTPVEFVVTTSWDIRAAVLRVFKATIADEAASELWRANPGRSAKSVLSGGQKTGFILLGFILILGAILWSRAVVTALVTLAGAVFLIGAGFTFFLAILGVKRNLVQRVSSEQLATLRDDELPRYTILVPLFRDAHVVPQMLDNLSGIDYPHDKLEILVLVEEKDVATREAILAAHPASIFTIVNVPNGTPQTKPRACNVGLFVASGEFLVIYDAEDVPEPDQLRKAVIAFRADREAAVCLRVEPHRVDSAHTALTRLVALERGYRTHGLLPGLDAANLPVPVGGTSDHFRTATLIELGGWDPYNVTEDADLGVRLRALGYRVGVIESTTRETSNASVRGFIRLRGRWLKGYMQTALVQGRKPDVLIRQVGLGRFLGIGMLLAGTPAALLSVIPLLVCAVAAIALPSAALEDYVPVWIVWGNLAAFVVGIALLTSLAAAAAKGPVSDVSAGWALLTPLYLVLLSIAAYKGLWQLMTKPHLWQKRGCEG